MQNAQPFDEDRDLSFQQIHVKHSDRIFRLILLFVVDQEESADLTTQVFLSAYRAWHRFNRGSEAAAWLDLIAANCCRNHLKQKVLDPLGQAGS